MARKLTNRDLGRELSKVPGFKEGRELQLSILRLGDRMRELRENELGISQLEAARLIGMNQSELSRIENGIGIRGPSFLTISRIIEAYRDYLHQRDAGSSLELTVHVSMPSREEEEQQYLIAG